MAPTRFRGLTERPIASQSQAWKVFIRPIPFVAMPFTGHILDPIRERIETASVVITDLTGANPNVYLEVGYAWGKGRPTIRLVQDVADLRFDVKSQRCLVYDRIIDLARLLSNELLHMHSRGLLQLPKTGT